MEILIEKISTQALDIIKSNLPMVLDSLNRLAIETDDDKIPEVTMTVKIVIAKEGQAISYQTKEECKISTKQADESEMETYDPKQGKLEFAK